MSTTYNTIAGDTFVTVAVKTTGDDTDAARIAFMNPGVSEPLAAGTALVVPDRASVSYEAAAGNPDEIAIKIEGKIFRYWESIRILRAVDAVSRVEFVTPFEPDYREFRDMFRPLQFKRIEVLIGGRSYITGRMGTITPNVTESRAVATVPCFAEAGILEVPNPPMSMFPIEFKGLNLRQIAESITAPFGVPVEFESDPGAPFDKVACPPTVRVLAFLAGLAQQRGLVIADKEPGVVVFRKSVAPGAPVGRLVQGESPLLGVTPMINEGMYFSDVTGIKPARPGTRGSQYTVKNPHLTGIVRPSNFTIADSDGGNPQTAAEAKLGRMFAGVAAYQTRVATIRAPNGDVWAPNTTVNVTAPGAMVYTEYEFLNRVVDIRISGASSTATLSHVIPESFTGGTPARMPWDE